MLSWLCCHPGWWPETLCSLTLEFSFCCEDGIFRKESSLAASIYLFEISIVCRIKTKLAQNSRKSRTKTRSMTCESCTWLSTRHGHTQTEIRDVLILFSSILIPTPFPCWKVAGCCFSADMLCDIDLIKHFWLSHRHFQHWYGYWNHSICDVYTDTQTKQALFSYSHTFGSLATLQKNAYLSCLQRKAAICVEGSTETRLSLNMSIWGHCGEKKILNLAKMCACVMCIKFNNSIPNQINWSTLAGSLVLSYVETVSEAMWFLRRRSRANSVFFFAIVPSGESTWRT